MTATRPATAARQRAEQRRLALEDPLGEHPGQRGGRGGDERVDHGERSAADRFEVGAGVEAEPADPQQRGADHGHDHRVRRHQFLAVAGALADHQRADEARDAGVDVHDGAAGEVDRAPQEDLTGVGHDLVELGLRGLLGGLVGRSRERLGGGVDRVRAGPVPDHVGDREVDQRHPERDEQRDRRELHAFGEGADDQRGRDRGERHLEADVDVLGDATPTEKVAALNSAVTPFRNSLSRPPI